jgi:hypothetical protein
VPSTPGDGELLSALRAFLFELDSAERDALAAAASSRVPVPLFLQDLALLMREGTFPIVFTTALDTLLERALGMQGLRSGLDFTVHHVRDAASADLSHLDGIAIVKLYCDELDSLGNQILGYVSRTGVVAYVTEADPSIAPQLIAAGPGGDIWWVGDPPAGRYRDGLEKVREARFVTGDESEPDHFFARLAFLLIQMPAINFAADPVASVQRATSQGDDPPSGSFTSTLALVAGTQPPESNEELQRLEAEWRRRRCRETLVRLREGTGTIDAAIVQQIEYQRAQLERLTVAAVAAGGGGDDLIGVLTRLREDPVLHANPDLGALITPLAVKVSHQLGRSEPDLTVVGAALDAVWAIAEGAGVEEHLLNELRSMSPARHA